MKQPAIDGPCIHWRGQSKIWLIKSKANGDHKVGHLFIIFLHFYSFNIVQRHFKFHDNSAVMFSVKKLFFMLIWKSCMFKNTFELFLTFWLCCVKFTFLFWRKLVGGNISIFKWHSKVLCAECAVCISMPIGKVPIHERALHPAGLHPPLPLPSFMSTTFSLSSKLPKIRAS